MGCQVLLVHSFDWKYRIAPKTVLDLVHLLQHEGIVGGPLSPASDNRPRWRPGLRLADKLGFQHSEGFGSIEIEVSDRMMVHCPTDFDTTCPGCGAEVDDSTWASLMNSLVTSEEAAVYRCPCGAQTEVPNLRYMPSVVFGHFAICFTDLGYEIDTSKPSWSELEALLGTELGVGRYKL